MSLNRISRREALFALGVAAMRPARADAGLLRATRVDHVSLAVGDIDKALVFYRSLFGNEVLKDSRTLDLNVTVASPRPKFALLSKSVQAENTDPPPMIHLGNPDELPQDGRLNFFLKAQVLGVFSGDPTGPEARAFHVDELQRVLSFYASQHPNLVLGAS